MSADYMTFGLAPAIRPGGMLPGGGYQTHREYLDFTVDGTPLLLCLDDVDAVSPLAADFGPSIFTAHVQRLLLESSPPLPGGRYVIYGCPECEGLGCGAVTAVIEQVPAPGTERSGDAPHQGATVVDGGEPDVIWRDFAWQTSERADLVRDGYRGVGPYRFRGDQYRGVLGELLHSPQARRRRRVLLIGQRASAFHRLVAALRQSGIGAEVASGVGDIPADELRSYAVVAFGRAVTEKERFATKAVFEAADADVTFLESRAPLVPVLTAQIEQALDQTTPEQRRLSQLRTADGQAVLEVAEVCSVRLTAYRLDRLYRVHTTDLVDRTLQPGTHRVELGPRMSRGRAFLVARTASSVHVVPVGK